MATMLEHPFNLRASGKPTKLDGMLCLLERYRIFGLGKRYNRQEPCKFH